MLVTFDTNAGAFKSLVPNYVEGSGESIAIFLPLHSEQSKGSIESAFSQVEQYVQGNLHELYALLDEASDDELRARLSSVHQQMQEKLSGMARILALVGMDEEGEGAEDYRTVRDDLESLGLLLAGDSTGIKDSLQLESVLIDPVSPEIKLLYGMHEVSIPLVVLSCDLDN